MTRNGGMPENAPSGAALQAATPAEQADPHLCLTVLKAQRPLIDAVPSGFDPLANLRERLANRPGFQFEERPPDDSKLF